MRDLPFLLDLVLALLVVIGAAFALIGAYGLAKFRDFLKAPARPHQGQHCRCRCRAARLDRLLCCGREGEPA